MLTCSICLNDIKRKMFVTFCNHVFHRDCMTECLSNFSCCPICRRKLDNTLCKKTVRLRKSNDSGYRWTEIVNMDGNMLSSIPLWI